MDVVEFDFGTKQERSLEAGEIVAQPAEGIFYFVMLDPGGEAAGRPVLENLGLGREVIETMLGPFQEARYELLNNTLHFSVSEAFLEEGKLEVGIIDCLLGSHFLVFRPEKASMVLSQIRSVYRHDFRAFARSSGFLLFELVSHLFEAYRRTYKKFVQEIEDIQLKLFGEVNDTIFREVAALTSDLLAFRRMVLASRDLFRELSVRKSTLVSETTQPSLDLMASRLERLGSDLESERTVLTESLNLYMGMVSHRTNRVINRLTVLSMIFLPLSFVCGVYGMNLKNIPEYEWAYSYPVFWAMVSIFVVSFVLFVRRKNWI